MMVRDFQQVIGSEVKQQIQAAAGRLPDALIACVGGGSNAMGLFHPFLEDAVELIGVEAAGKGIGTRQARGGPRRGQRGRAARLQVLCPSG